MRRGASARRHPCITRPSLRDEGLHTDCLILSRQSLMRLRNRRPRCSMYADMHIAHSAKEHNLKRNIISMQASHVLKTVTCQESYRPKSLSRNITSNVSKADALGTSIWISASIYCCELLPTVQANNIVLIWIWTYANIWLLSRNARTHTHTQVDLLHATPTFAIMLASIHGGGVNCYAFTDDAVDSRVP